MCVVVLWWCVCVVCGEAWHTLSLSCSLSFLFSFPFFFSLIFLFLSSFSLAPSLTLALALVLSLSLLSSYFPSTHSSLLFPSRQQTLLKISSRHGLWLRRSRLMSSIPLLFRSYSMKTSLANDFAVVHLETKKGPFNYRNISGDYSFK